MAGFILDFYEASARLCVEVDGDVHDDPEQRLRDLARTAALEVLGVRVIRFSNEEVLADTPGVLRRIRRVLAEAAPPYSPLPHAGEGGEP